MYVVSLSRDLEIVLVNFGTVTELNKEEESEKRRNQVFIEQYQQEFEFFGQSLKFLQLSHHN